MTDPDPHAAATDPSPAALGKLVPDDAFDLASPNLTDDQIFDRFLDWAHQVHHLDLWPHQEESILCLLSGDHVIANTPTGSGKSMIAIAMHFMALCQGEKSCYTAPIKALVSEKFFELVSIFGPAYVGMITGDTRINADAPIICCTAEILANQALREGERGNISCVAMDEFHFYGDSDRGWAWQVPLITLHHTQFLLMSATLGDVQGVEDLLEEQTDRPVDLISDAKRPVPLEYQYLVEPLPNVVNRLIADEKTPIYIVHFSQDAAVSAAENLAGLGVASKEQREKIKQALEHTKFTTAFGKTLRRFLINGIGVHHAGMLPRYRRMVEQLAQDGLLPVICGTDTLGVGINVPIHTVVFTALTKYDGYKQRRLRAREFHQIAGRAGRSGFDTEGLVIALAPDHEIENAKAVAKTGDDPRKLKKIKKKKAPEGFVNWSEDTFSKLIDAQPETLQPHLTMTHSLVLNEICQGGDAWKRIKDLIEASAQSETDKDKLRQQAASIMENLMDSGIVEKWELDDGSMDYTLAVDMPDDFAMNQPLSPFLIAALELLDPDSPSYALDVVSMVEATLENPRQILRVQEKRVRDEAMLRMKDEGLDYDERMEKLQTITYPQPLKELLMPAFSQYLNDMPWAADYQLEPKSIVRDMVERSSDFTQYIAAYGVPRSEGNLLRYLSDAYRALSRTVPPDKVDQTLGDITQWLGYIVRTVDSSLVDEWEDSYADQGKETNALTAAPPTVEESIVANRRALTLLVRNALFRRVQLMAIEDSKTLGGLDSDFGYNQRDWDQVLDDFYQDHEEILTDADARSLDYFILDESEEKKSHRWHVRQVIRDFEGDNDWAIDAQVDLAATQEEGQVVFSSYRVGRSDELI
ncbi:MAG: DEAD/DEAH box helicase [Parascardovia denticolens]